MEAFACASIAVDACCRIWFFANSVVSSAKSASSMPPLAADKLADMLVRLLTVWLSLLETAPSSARWMLIVLRPLSIVLIKTRVSAYSRPTLAGPVPATFALIPRLRPHNQNRTVAARAIADMKTFGHLS